jgi:uncharacterized protein (DUF952 family)
MTDLIYKIESRSVWDATLRDGDYTGSPLDKTDGFIHLSAANQVRETAAKWFAGREGLVLIAVSAPCLGETLVWEASRDGALFPHVYGTLPAHCVVKVVDMPLDPAGQHLFEPEIP